ncbi:acyltransferase family protein, partial [Actinocorallia lasiicapitis]
MGRRAVPSAARPAGPRTRELDGLRGVAIVMVVAVHVAELTAMASPGTPVWRLVAACGGGVPVFFVLSGYLLYRPWLRGPVAVGGYYRRRLVRILPAHWAVTAVALPVFSPHHAQDLRSWAELLTLTHLYDPRRWWIGSGPVALGPVWSLAVEAAFYLLLPLLARLRIGTVAALAVGCAVFTWWLRTHASYGAFSYWHPLLPRWFPYFAAGMALAVLVERGWRPSGGRWLAVGAC